MSDREEHFSEIDEFFMGIAFKYAQLVSTSAEESMSQVLSACTELVGDNARTALEDFKKLYFGSDDIATQSTAVNESVDDLFDQLQNQMANGEELSIDDSSGQIGEVESDNRLALSGLQKQLEQVISLGEDVKTKLKPLVNCSDIEEQLRSSVDAICSVWNAFLTAKPESAEEFELLLKPLVDDFSNEDKTAFYETVLGEKYKEIQPDESLGSLLFGDD